MILERVGSYDRFVFAVPERDTTMAIDELERMDENSKAAKLPTMPSSYLRRMFTDTVSPHAMGVKFPVDFYGADHVLYGNDYPCWNPESALRVFNELELSHEDRHKILYDNARRVFNLREPEQASAAEVARGNVASRVPDVSHV